MMRALGVAASVLLTSLALAGCLEPADDEEPSTTQTNTGALITYGNTGSRTSSTTSTTSSATSTTSSENHPPTGALSVVVNGTEAGFTITGTDVDGDTLTWALDFGDGESTSGTVVPAAANHTYTAGNYTANLILSDGTGQATYEVEVLAAAAGGSPLQTVAGGFAFGAADGGASSEIFLCGSSPMDGVTHFRFAVDGATQGLPFTASITDASGGAAIQDWGIIFFEDGCLAFEVVSVAGSGPLAGTVPAGAAIAAVISTGGAALEVTYSSG